MYAWSWVYLPFSTPLLVAVWILLLTTSDACQQALAGSRPPVNVVLAALIALGWIVPPLVADRLYSARLSKGREGDTGSIAPSLVAQFLIVAVVVVLWGASTTHQSYRVSVSFAFSDAASARSAVTEDLLTHGRVRDAARLETALHYSRIAEDGTITATVARRQRLLNGSTIQLTPRLHVGGVDVDWTCRSELPDVCLPAECRRRQ